MTEKDLAVDYRMVLHEAESMGCNKIKALYNIPLKNMEMIVQALEKQIPKKPIFNHNLSDTLSVFYCECGNTIKVSHDIGIMNNNNAPNYCSKCGCRLDWSDEE